MKKMCKYIVVGLLACFAMMGCEPEEVPQTPSMVIDSLVIIPTYEDVSILCRFRSNVTISTVSVYLSTSLDFSQKEKVVLQAEAPATFSGKIDNLQDGSLYYVQVEVQNRLYTTSLDEILEFSTMPLSAPIMTPTEVAEVTFNSAVIDGEIISNGGREVSRYGVVYGTTTNPTIEKANVIEAEALDGKWSCFIGHLEKDLIYYARTYAVNEMGVAYGDEVSFEVDTLWKGRDLGLSVNWGHTNVGAICPEDAGDYFAWGEIAPKAEYNWRYYLHCNQGDPQQITKYAPYVDKLSTLEPEDDAATMNWGGNWRMPTQSEWNELREKCEWRWVTVNNVKGYQVTNRANGASIFLPAAGKKDGRTLFDQNEVGYYWTRWLATKHEAKSYIMHVYSDWSAQETRCYGLSVRAVCPKK
jgi:hypothetical protein